MEPPWTLTGGGALVGFHLHHRRTRDLDLFWRGADRLGESRHEVARRLKADGLRVESLHSSDSFQRLSATGGGETVILDLVAEPVAAVEPAIELGHGGTRIRVDTPHEILVNKLCTLLGRAEYRDLVDVRALLAQGGDLERALRDAPRKDGGFSTLTLAWILRGLPVDAMATEEGVGEAERHALERFRDELVARLTAAARPDA
jgi:hypothetical protein